MIVAVAQMKCITYDKEANFKIAAALIEQAVEKKAELIVLPELFNTGYCCTERDWELAEEPEGETEAFLRKYAEKYHCTILGGFVEKSGIKGLVYNSLLTVAPGKKAEVYRKIYLWGAEKNRFIKGKKLKLCKMPKATLAPQICYEVGFSENSRMLALSGADLLIYSSAFGKARYYAWDIATRARALETGCYVLASNHSDIEGDISFCGHSRIVDPLGQIVCEVTEDNGLAVADIDLEKIYGQRNDLPYLRDIDLEMVKNGYAAIEK